MPLCLARAPARAALALSLCAALSVLAARAHAQVAPRPAPSPEHLAALELLESEVDGFLSRARSYHEALQTLLARRRGAQLGAIRERYARQITAEREAESQARRHAIDVFEGFLERYPDDANHTPDVMLRLAELYYDEAAWAKLASDERLDALRESRASRGLATDDLAADPLDQRCAVLLFRHVTARFASFRLRDAAHYLLAWTLNEMGQRHEAATAHRALACPASSAYVPRLDLALPVAPSSAPLACPRVAALLRPLAPALLSPPPAASAQNDGDRTALAYEACVPMRGPAGQPSRYAAEALYQLGDYHFDQALPGDGGRAFASAAAAYRASMHLSESPRLAGDRAPRAQLPPHAELDPALAYGPYWPRALYRLGWTHFSVAGGHAPALRAFTRLLDYYDYVAPRDAATTGSRDDTLRWIGVILAEHGWDSGDDTLEAARCQPLVEREATPPPDATRPFECAGLARATRPGLLHQDRAWTPDAYLALAGAYFTQTRYYEAIALYRLYLARFPLHFGVPRASAQVALAYDRQRQYDQARASRLGAVAVLTRWTEAHRDDPAAVREADALLLSGLREAAVQTHQHARETRLHAEALTACLTVTPPPGCPPLRTPRERAEHAALAREASARADRLYLRAAEAYAALVARDPHEEHASEHRFSRAEALFWARRHEAAAAAYAEVRDAHDDDRFAAPAARMVVRAREAQLIALARESALDPCDAARAGLAPEVLTRLDSSAPLLDPARTRACTAPSSAALPVPDAVRALLLARDAYTLRVGRDADARVAFLNAVALERFGQHEAAETRLRALLASRCDDAEIAPRAYAALANLLLDEGRHDDREALAREQSLRACTGVGTAGVREVLTDARLRRASLALAEAERAPAPDAPHRVERAASELLAAARENPAHRESPIALLSAARALERAGSASAAAQVYESLLARYGDAREGAYASLLGVLDEARHRAALARERTLALEAALAHYEALAGDPRTARADGHDARTRDALAALATLNTQLGRHDRAREAYRALAARASTQGERAEALFHAAEAPLRAGNHREAVAALRAFRAEVPLEAATVGSPGTELEFAL